jgi:cytosine/adenosine deaminase-related metal-dependent hydrolase
LFNAHTHLYSGLAPLGMPAPASEPASFVAILEAIWWKLDRALDAESLRASARFYVAEAIGAGCRGLVDHHESPGLIAGSLDILADACQELGMPALLCYGATERNRGRAEATAGLDECRRFAQENDRPLIRAAVGLHAAFTVSDETIADAAALARSLEIPLHVHVAEDAADVEDARDRGYAGVIDRLDSLDALIPGSIFAHGVHLEQSEIALLDRREVWLVQNPRSNRGNRVGYPAALGASSRVALGTDGYRADMAEEARALEELAPEHGEDAAVAADRLAGSARLFARIFAGDPPPPPAAALPETVTAIRAEAEAAAPRLWERMMKL